jgi:hypothetical protein
VASNKGLPVFSVTIHVVTITYCDGHSPCKTDMHDTSASLQSLEADNFAVPCAPAFKSVVERWPPEIPSGPGMHYSPEHERLTTSVSPERMGLNESRRGSSSFLGPGRPLAARRSIGPDPGHIFNQVAEMKKWLRGGGKSVARASICARVSRIVDHWGS